MSDATIAFDILARDKASAAFQSAGSSADGLGSKLGALAKVAGAAAVAGAAVFVKGAFDAASEAMKVTAQTEAVLKSTGNAAGVTAEHIGDFAHKLQGISGVSDEAIQTGQNMLLTFTNLKNGVGEGNDIFDQATQTMLDMSVATGTDAKSSAVQLGKALNDPIKGISALSRVGVTFTQQQKDQIKAMVEAGDTAGAQKVILAELNKEFGGSAKAVGDAMTPMERFSLWAGDVQESLGLFLIPAIEKLSKAFGTIFSFLMENKEILAGVGVAIAVIVAPAFIAWATAAGAAALATIAAAAPIIALGLVIAGLVAGILFLVQNWDEVWAKVKQIAGTVIDAVIGFVKDLPGRALDALKSTWQTFAGHWSTVFTAVKTFVSDRVGDIVGFITGLPGRAKDGLVSTWQTFWSYFSDLATSIGSTINDAVGAVVGFVTGLPGRAKNALVGAWGTFWGYYTGLGQSIRDVVSTAFDAVVGFVTAMPGRIVTAASGMFDGIKDAFRGAVNWLIDKWNDLEFTIGGQEISLPFGMGFTIPSVTLRTPNLPRLHDGGTFRAATFGGEGLALLRDREQVTTPETMDAVVRELRAIQAQIRHLEDNQTRIARAG